MTSEIKKTRKRNAPYSEDALRRALSEIREKHASIRKVCREYGIPKSTVLDRIHGRTTDEMKKRGPDPVLGAAGEKKIVDWLIAISKCGFPIKKQELLDSVQKIIIDSGIPNKFKNNRPGQTWYVNFLKRHPEISCRSAEGINRARANITEESIRLWFKNLEFFLDETNQRDVLSRPRSIFNADESGFALCPKTGKVLGPKGFRNLYQIKQGNEKDNLTVLVTFNANGEVCPPCVVFPYIRPPRAVVESMPPDWCLGRSESGWMRGDVFFEYVTNDFNNWLERKKIQKPVLLLVDGHKSHMSLMLSTVCEQLQIILYALPPNTTHILQPADVSVFAPLKANWKNTVRKFLTKPEHLNASVTKTNFCQLFFETLQESNLTTCIKNGFKRCGLYPLDPNAPDYSKCVRNTLENISSSRQQQSSKEISRSDITITKKVLKHLKSTLKEKKVKVSVIMKELNILRKSLPVEQNPIEISIDTESDYTSGNLSKSHQDISDLDPSLAIEHLETITTDMHPISDDLQHSIHDIPNDLESSVVQTVTAEIHPTPDDVQPSTMLTETILQRNEDLDSISTLHLSGLPEVGSIISFNDILILPCSEDIYSLNHQSFSNEPLIIPETHSSQNTPELLTSPITTSTPNYAHKKIESYLPNSSSIVPERPTQKKPAEPLTLLPIASSSLNAIRKESESYLSDDPFQRHLYLPDQPEKVTKSSKYRIPAAISSAAWREHYEIQERTKNIKKEETKKRKIERSEKLRQAKIRKEMKSNQKIRSRLQPRRKNSRDMDMPMPSTWHEACKENYQGPSAAAGTISCSKCDDQLISDVEEDENKNIGCDVCPRWYHLKCTLFVGKAYQDVKDEPYKCNLCD